LSDAALLNQVSETEREDLEESEKVQHWVERLCQTRLEQISCVENESPEVQSETSSVKTSPHSGLLNSVFLSRITFYKVECQFFFTGARR